MRVKKSQLFLKRRKRKFKIFLIIFVIFFLFCLIYWFIFLSNFFQIKEIKIINYKEELKQELIKEINQYFQERNKKFVPLSIFKIFSEVQDNYRNMLLFSREGLNKYLKNKHPEFKEIKSGLVISRQILNVEINLRKIEYLFCQTENFCYLVDNSGVVFDVAPAVSGSLIKKIIDPNLKDLKLGTTLFNKEFWQKIERYYLLTNKKDSPIQINSIILDSQDLSSIKIKTPEKWFLYLNLKENPEYILKIISQIKEEKDLSKIEYIDCRFLPKIYLK